MCAAFAPPKQQRTSGAVSSAPDGVGNERKRNRQSPPSLARADQPTTTSLRPLPVRALNISAPVRPATTFVSAPPVSPSGDEVSRSAPGSPRAVPSFAEIAKGVIRQDVSNVRCDPFARARARAAETERERRSTEAAALRTRARARRFAGVFGLLLLVALASRFCSIGPVATTMHPEFDSSKKGGSAAQKASKKRSSQQSGSLPDQPKLGLFAAAAKDLPVIVSSRQELAEVFAAAGIKAKGRQVEEAWTVLTTGHVRRNAGVLRSLSLAMAVVTGGALRNRVASAVIAIVILLAIGLWYCAWAPSGDGDSAFSLSEAWMRSGVSVNGFYPRNGGRGETSGLGRRSSATSLSPRRLVGMY